MSRIGPPALLLLLGSCTSCGSGGGAPTSTATRGTPTEDLEEEATGEGASGVGTEADVEGANDGNSSSGAARSASLLGTNLDLPRDWSQAVPFIDGFRLSRTWASAPGPRQPGDDQPIDVDAHGWVRSVRPTQRIRTGIYWDVDTVRGGHYTVRWSGRGRITTFGGAADRITEEAPGRMTVDWDPAEQTSGFGLAILESDPQNPVRDIQVLPPGGACRADHARFCDDGNPCEGGDECLRFVDHHEELVFHPDFLATLSIYRVIRFMNWQLTNESPERTWEDRPRMDDARWSEHGIPPEVLVDLANRVDADMWICVPHRADDGYARELGALVRERLDPELTVRVELSNELWNRIFSQWQYAFERGRERGLAGPDEDPSFAQIRWVAKRSTEIFQAFDEGFGEGADERVIHVLGSHSANPWVAEQMLSFEDTAAHVDELAVAPYFGPLIGPADRERVLQGGVEEVLRDTRTSLATVFGHVRELVALAERFDVRLTAYEGGQHVVAVGGAEQDDALRELLAEANRHPEMGAIYSEFLEGWREAGGTLFMHFVNVGGWGRHGTWGALEHPRQDPATAPKYLALERFANGIRADTAAPEASSNSETASP